MRYIIYPLIDLSTIIYHSKVMKKNIYTTWQTGIGLKVAAEIGTEDEDEIFQEHIQYNSMALKAQWTCLQSCCWSII